MIRSGGQVLVALALALVTAACSAGSGPASAGSTPTTEAFPTVIPEDTPTASAAPTFYESAITVVVDGRRVLPTPGRVNVRVGERVRLTVISDVDNEVRVHGVDVARRLPANHPVTFVVANDRPGVYPVDLRHPALLLFRFVVR